MLIPRAFLDSVVAIFTAGGRGDGRATAFFLTHTLEEPTGPPRELKFLVTNRHVLEGDEEASVRLNPRNGASAVEFPFRLVDSAGRPLWYAHKREDLDLAVVPVSSVPELRFHERELVAFNDRVEVARLADLDRLRIVEGEPVHVLGFPAGIRGIPDKVIVRTGAIALMEETIAGREPNFLIDASVFPGNSGGPVIYRPSGIALKGAPQANRAYLIGVVHGYLPYEETVETPETKRQITLGENSGISAVCPMDHVFEIIAGIPRADLSLQLSVQPGMARVAAKRASRPEKNRGGNRS